MKVSFFRALALAGTVALLPLAAPQPAGAADDFPARDLRVVVPMIPGGGTDTITRQLTEPLARQLGKPVVVENRGGAGTRIGMNAVANAPADGYMTVVNGDTVAIFHSIFEELKFDVFKDFVPVAYFASAPIVLAAHAGFPANNVSELVEMAKAAPGTVAYATPGVGTPHDLAGLLMMQRAGIDLNEINYTGNGQALIDLMAGHVSIGMYTISNVLPHIESGALKALAVVSDQRSPVAPDIPSMAESGLPGVNVAARYVLLAPAGTPQARLEKLNEAVRAVTASPDVQQNFLSRGYETMGTDLNESAAMLLAERDRWKPILDAAGIKPQ